jgi:flagellum-specific ATP synthase
VTNPFLTAQNDLEQILPFKVIGSIRRSVGLGLEAVGLNVPVGSLCLIESKTRNLKIEAELVGFDGELAQLMCYGTNRGISRGDKVSCIAISQKVGVGPDLLGRTLDGRGFPMDDKGPVFYEDRYPLYAPPPAPLTRDRISKVLSTGVRAIDGLLTLGEGQRIGIFAGTGVGKSVLMGMISRYTTADINVIVLTGERGREVKDFIERDLGEEGIKRSVLIVSTGDRPALERLRAAYVGTAIADYFRDQGKNVILRIDSVTRLAFAQREIGLTFGEPPATKGYPPSVFALFPPLLERAGRSDKGSITGIYTVLVEADDLADPIADTVRGILDGHFVLSRKLATQGHYPALDILESISRVQPDIISGDLLNANQIFKSLMAAYAKAEDLIMINAYAPGTDIEVDLAIKFRQVMLAYLRQDIMEQGNFDEATKALLNFAQVASSEQKN